MGSVEEAMTFHTPSEGNGAKARRMSRPMQDEDGYNELVLQSMGDVGGSNINYNKAQRHHNGEDDEGGYARNKQPNTTQGPDRRNGNHSHLQGDQSFNQNASVLQNQSLVQNSVDLDPLQGNSFGDEQTGQYVNTGGQRGYAKDLDYSYDEDDNARTKRRANHIAN